MAERGREDTAIIGLLFHGALRRSEVAALVAGDVEAGEDGTALVTVRQSKTNQEGARRDVRLVKNGYAAALLALCADLDSDEPVFYGLNGASIGRRFAAAARHAGFKATAHSG